MPVTDVFLAFPALVLAMAVAIAIGPGAHPYHDGSTGCLVAMVCQNQSR